MRCIYFRALGLVLALAVVAVPIGGCGGGSGGGGDGAQSEGYGEILHGLRRAALAHVAYGTYDAVGRARSLALIKRASLNAFCEVAREMVINEEAGKAAEEPYYVTRIKLRAERELPFVSTGPVNTAVRELAGVFNLDAFDAREVHNYEKACYQRRDLY